MQFAIISIYKTRNHLIGQKRRTASFAFTGTSIQLQTSIMTPGNRIIHISRTSIRAQWPWIPFAEDSWCTCPAALRSHITSVRRD